MDNAYQYEYHNSVYGALVLRIVAVIYLMHMRRLTSFGAVHARVHGTP